MAAGDKYAKAKGLSKLFEEMLKKTGAEDKAKDKMDEEIGPAWVVEIEVEDDGFDLPGMGMSEGKKATKEEAEDMLKKARELMEKDIGPAQDLILGPDDEYAEEEEEDEEEVEIEIGPEASSLLRALAAMLEGK